MISESGHYYNGRDSRQQTVSITLENHMIRIAGLNLDIAYPPSEVRLSPPLGKTRRSLYLPDGGKCELSDGPLTDALTQELKTFSLYATLHHWEKSLKRAFLALAFTLLILWGFMRYGLPLLAKEVAYAIPSATEEILGRESLEVLDRILLEPSTLSDERRSELTLLFHDVVSDFQGHNYRLEFRGASSLGPNALALPSGIIVLTDELAILAENNEELAAVIAHEAGHVEHRHALRQTLQKSATGLIIATLTGDALSATSLAASLPTVLAEARFSRDLEREADDAAVNYLRRHEISVYRFADILIRLEKNVRKEEASSPSLWERLLSTHPSTEDRLRRLKR